MLSGKITEPDDWQKALQDILSSPFEESSVLTIISDSTCGSIGVSQNRYLTGAHTSAGETGVPALRQLIALKMGFYSYLSAEAIQDRQNIDQGLKVDITVLISAAAGQPATQNPADEATSELRKTFQALRPVSAQRIPPPPPPPPPVAPKQAGNGGTARNVAPGDDFSYTPGTIEQSSGTGRKRTNPLDKIVYGAKSTAIKLASLSAFRAQQNQANPQSPGFAPPLNSDPAPTGFAPPLNAHPAPTGFAPPLNSDPAPTGFAPPLNSASGSPSAFNASPADQPAVDSDGLSRPMPPPPPPAAAFVAQPSAPAPEPEMSIVENVRATAWRMVSRVAQAAKLNEFDEVRNENRKLRTLETDTTDDTEAEKKKRTKWPPDTTTLTLMVAVGLGVVVVIGAGVVAWQTNSTGYFMAAGKKYLAAGRTDLAVAQFTLALDKNSSDADALQLRAQIYEQLKDYEHAEADYLRLAGLKSNAVAAARKAAFNKFKLHKYEDAAAYCKNLLAREPDDESLKAQYAMNLARLGKYREAADSGSTLDIELVPEYLVPDFFGSLGYAWGRLGDSKKAIDFYSRAIKADPSNADVLADRATTYMALHDYKRATADKLAITKIFPERGSAYVDLAQAYEAGQDYTAAVKQYENAIKHGATAELYMHLADCHLKLGKPGYAVADCDAALSLDKRAKGAIRLKAVALGRAKSEKALVIAQIPVDTYIPVARKSNLTKAEIKDPLTEVGYAQLSSKNPSAAVLTLTEAIRRTPGDLSAHRYLANALMDLQRDKEAFDQYNFIANNNGLLPSDELDYARAAGQTGHSDRAIELFFTVVNRDPTYLTARLDLIKTLVAKGFVDRAQVIAQEGIKLNPANEKVLKEALSYKPGG